MKSTHTKHLQKTVSRDHENWNLETNCFKIHNSSQARGAYVSSGTEFRRESVTARDVLHPFRNAVSCSESSERNLPHTIFSSHNWNVEIVVVSHRRQKVDIVVATFAERTVDLTGAAEHEAVGFIALLARDADRSRPTEARTHAASSRHFQTATQVTQALASRLCEVGLRLDRVRHRAAGTEVADVRHRLPSKW